MPSRRLALALFVVGIALVLNPVYLFPDGAPYEAQVRYESELVDEVADSDVVTSSGSVLSCSNDVWHTQCLQARRVGYGGTLRVEADAVGLPRDDPAFDYRFVDFPQGWTQTNATVANGTLVLSYEPVPTERVLSAYAFPFDELPAVGKRAIREGSAATSRWVATRNLEPLVPREWRLVERDGEFYRLSLERKVYVRAFPPWLLGLARVLGVGGGGALAFVGARWHALSEADPDREGWDLHVGGPDEND